MRAYRGLLIGIALLLLWVVRPIGVEAPRAVDTEFDTARAIARLEFILGDQKPHPTGTDANDAVLARLEQQVRGLGFTPEVSERFHCNDWRAGAAVCASPRNLMFWVTAPGPDAVMVTAAGRAVAAITGLTTTWLSNAAASRASRRNLARNSGSSATSAFITDPAPAAANTCVLDAATAR